MNDFRKIVENIKNVISIEKGNQKIFDKDVAKILGISQSQIATNLNRNKLPLKEILDFCAKKAIVANVLLYDQLPESLLVNTNRYFNYKYHIAS